MHTKKKMVVMFILQSCNKKGSYCTAHLAKQIVWCCDRLMVRVTHRAIKLPRVLWFLSLFIINSFYPVLVHFVLKAFVYFCGLCLIVRDCAHCV
jgi:hypothetical protein